MEYNSALVGPGGVPSIQKWSENSGKLYREKMAEGVAETMKMVRLDMGKPRYPATEGSNVNKAKAIGKKNFSVERAIEISGEPLDEQPNRVILRNETGRLVSVPR
jgi:hypothetical protein